MSKLMAVSMLLVAGAISTGCGGGGACVLPSIRSGWEYCHDNWDSQECSSRSGTFHSTSCNQLGFTKACPADGSNTYRLPSYGC